MIYGKLEEMNQVVITQSEVGEVLTLGDVKGTILFLNILLVSQLIQGGTRQSVHE